MFSFFTFSLRQTVSVFLVSITLFFGIAVVGNSSAIAAEAITRDVTNLNSADGIKDEAYESMKAGRQREQARRSQQAEAQADYEAENETVAEKLNLNEGLPRSTEKFIDQVTGDEPIDNETRP